MSDFRTAKNDVLIRIVEGMFINGEPRFQLRIGFDPAGTAELTTDELRTLREMVDQAIRYGEYNAAGPRQAAVPAVRSPRLPPYPRPAPQS